jgi:NAD(P)-dependent dehydrogenase (short-subunit alcohol dehydrogenase family)
MPVAVILGLGSDIGRELAKRYSANNWTVWGTHRDSIDSVQLPLGVSAMYCDLTSTANIAAAVEAFRSKNLYWDVLIVAVGTEEPIGPFWDCDEEDWDRGIEVNALAPLRFVRRLYSLRNQSAPPSVAFFSGAGTNNAAPAYSAYCASKIMLIKMCELLDAESPDTSFFIIGPGIVRTKIHEQTLREPASSGSNYRKVVEFLRSNNPGTSHDDIYACLNWCLSSGKSVVGGRNIALAHDAWRQGGTALARQLCENTDFYKMRRFGNELHIIDGDI